MENTTVMLNDSLGEGSSCQGASMAVYEKK